MAMKPFSRNLTIGILAIAALALVTKGCEYFPESSFELANESRLPKWITLPPGLTRADVSLTMNYYSAPWGYDTQFILRNKNNQTIEKKVGNGKCQPGFQLRNPPQGFPPGYPAYIPVTVKGVTEIIEHKKPEPLFYVTDDPLVWKQYSAFGCD
jgi:hypothetical protein